MGKHYLRLMVLLLGNKCGLLFMFGTVFAYVFTCFGLVYLLSDYIF